MHEAVKQVTLEEFVRASAPSAWVIEMHEHFAKTGTYRPADLDRVLGDPTLRVKAGTSMDAKAFFGIQ